MAVNGMDAQEWREFYPNGRTFYLEDDGADVAMKFLAECHLADLEPTISVHVPGDKPEVAIRLMEEYTIGT